MQISGKYFFTEKKFLPVYIMDTESPMFMTLATAILTSVLLWAYCKYVLKQKHAEKILAKSLVAGLVASACVLVIVQNTQPRTSLHSEPFFAPLV